MHNPPNIIIYQELIEPIESAIAELNKIAKVFIAMGNLGFLSRIVGFSYGSCLTYGYVQNSMAPGQIPVKDLAQICRTFYSKVKI